jgi:hypothetical protein
VSAPGRSPWRGPGGRRSAQDLLVAVVVAGDRVAPGHVPGNVVGEQADQGRGVVPTGIEGRLGPVEGLEQPHVGMHLASLGTAHAVAAHRPAAGGPAGPPTRPWRPRRRQRTVAGSPFAAHRLCLARVPLEERQSDASRLPPNVVGSWTSAGQALGAKGGVRQRLGSGWAWRRSSPGDGGHRGRAPSSGQVEPSAPRCVRVNLTGRATSVPFTAVSDGAERTTTDNARTASTSVVSHLRR